MTIADNLEALANQKLGYQDSVEACKTSLANKDVVVPVSAKLADISGLIDEIEQGSGNPSIPVGTGQHLVTFYDFDGKVLKRQRVNTGEDATAPAILTHQYLTFAEWNNPFTNVQSDIDTGAIYNTTDGKTYLFITLTPVTGLAPTLYFSKSSTSLMTIDWGDGSTSTSTTSGNQSINHVYATAGDYIITVDNSAGGTYFFGGDGATMIFGTNNYILTKIYLGANLSASVGQGGWALYNQKSLKFISTNNLNRIEQLRGSAITHCNLSNFNHGGSLFYQCSNINKIVASNLSTTTHSRFDCFNLRGNVFSENVATIPANTFSGNYSSIYYIFLSTIPPTLANINAFTGINPICKIYVPDASVEAYKAATNWNNFSSYIYPLSQKPQPNE